MLKLEAPYLYIEFAPKRKKRLPGSVRDANRAKSVQPVSALSLIRAVNFYYIINKG